MKTFGDNVRIAREKVGKTQREMAELIGVAQSVYCQYETSYKTPNVYLAQKIAEILNCSVDDLLNEV